MLWIGLVYRSMPPLSDWQIRLSATLQHIGQVMTNALSWVPNWAGALIFLALLGGLAWYALRQVGGRAASLKQQGETTETHQAIETEAFQTLQEEPVEYKNKV